MSLFFCRKAGYSKKEKYDELQEQANTSLKIIPQNTDVYYWMLTASYHKGGLQYLKRELNVISGVLFRRRVCRIEKEAAGRFEN